MITLFVVSTTMHTFGMHLAYVSSEKRGVHDN